MFLAFYDDEIAETSGIAARQDNGDSLALALKVCFFWFLFNY